MRKASIKESLDKVLELCNNQILDKNSPKRLVEGLKVYRNEILINRATIGDAETAIWLDWNVRVTQLRIMYGKGKDF